VEIAAVTTTTVQAAIVAAPRNALPLCGKTLLLRKSGCFCRVKAVVAIAAFNRYR
jgi:hypothetical protein